MRGWGTISVSIILLTWEVVARFVLIVVPIVLMLFRMNMAIRFVLTPLRFIREILVSPSTVLVVLTEVARLPALTTFRVVLSGIRLFVGRLDPLAVGFPVGTTWVRLVRGCVTMPM